ncbi:MAG: hypothetical protein SNJ29_12730 [Rikenellaceae bacterium]
MKHTPTVKYFQREVYFFVHLHYQASCSNYKKSNTAVVTQMGAGSIPIVHPCKNGGLD